MLTEVWQRNLTAVWFAQVLTMMAFSFVFPFMPLYIETLGVDNTMEAAQWAGAVGAASAISMSVAQPIWGNLADRWGRKPMVIRSMIGGSIMILLMGMATSPWQLLVLRFIQGGITGTIAASNALISTTTPKHHLGFALGAVQMGLFLGTSMGPLIGGAIADAFDYRVPFYLASALMMAGGLIVLVLVRENFSRPAPSIVKRSILAESRSLLAIGTFPILISTVFIIHYAAMVIMPVLSLFIASLSDQGNAATAAGTVLAATGAMSAISALALGRLSDKIGHTLILQVCLVGAALTFIPQALVQEVWQLVILRMLLGLFMGGLMPSVNALVASMVSQERRGAAFGLSSTATSLAGVAGPLSGAGIASLWNMRAVFVVTGLLFAVAYGWMTIGFRRNQATIPQPQRRTAASAANPDEASPGDQSSTQPATATAKARPPHQPPRP